LVVISWCNCLSSMVIISFLSSQLQQAGSAPTIEGVLQARYYFLVRFISWVLMTPGITFWSGSPPGSWHRPSPGLTGHGELLDQILEKTITPRPEPEPRSGWLGVHRILLNNSPNLPGLHFIPREASVQVWFGIVWEVAVQAKPRFQPLALASTYTPPSCPWGCASASPSPPPHFPQGSRQEEKPER